MADTTTASPTGGMNQAGIIALLQQLGLGQYAGQAVGGAPTDTSQGIAGQMALANQTVNGKPAQYDPGTVNLQGGGYTDQQLMEGLTGAAGGSGLGGNGAGWSTSNSVSGAGNTGMGSAQSDPYWWPKNNSELKSYYAAQTKFKQDQADSITELLKSLNGGSSAAAPSPVGALNDKMPPSAPVSNTGGAVYTNPADAKFAGMGASTAGAALPSPAAPTAATPSFTANGPQVTFPYGSAAGVGGASSAVVPQMPTQPAPMSGVPANDPTAVMQMIQQRGGPLQASSGSGIQIGSLPSAPVSSSFAPMTTSSDTGGPSNIAPAPSQFAGLRNYTSSPAPAQPVSTSVVGAGGQGNLPDSQYRTPVVGPAVVNAPGGGYTTNPNASPTNIGTWSPAPGSAGDPDPNPSAATMGNYAAGGDQAAAAGGGGMTGAQAGNAAAGLISAIGNALKPTFIPNTAPSSTVLNSGYFRPTQFRAPSVMSQPMR
jgi:hypothetical protein